MKRNDWLNGKKTVRPKAISVDVTNKKQKRVYLSGRDNLYYNNGIERGLRIAPMHVDGGYSSLPSI